MIGARILRFCMASTMVMAMVTAMVDAAAAQTEELRGRPRVLSGDQLRLGDTTVQLYGIDAPELDQYCENAYGRPYQCGLMALDALSEMVAGSTVVCLPEGHDGSAAVLGLCYAGDTNINSRLVRTGWAVARAEQRADYVPLQDLAKSEKRGIWQFVFEDPRVWRERKAAD